MEDVISRLVQIIRILNITFESFGGLGSIGLVLGLSLSRGLYSSWLSKCSITLGEETADDKRRKKGRSVIRGGRRRFLVVSVRARGQDCCTSVICELSFGY